MILLNKASLYYIDLPTNSPMPTRKQFLQQLITAAAGTSLIGFESIASPSAKAPLTFDFHCHPGLFPTKGTDRYAGDAAVMKTVNAMNASHFSGAFFSLVADMPLISIGPTGVTVSKPYAKGEAWAEYKRQRAVFKEVFQPNNVKLSTKASDLETYAKQDKVAAFLGCEGGDLFEGIIDRVDEAYKDGVRSIQLVHYAPNDVGDLQTAESMHNGLSAFGKNVVKRMNSLGMVVDVAHATFKTVKDAAEITTMPIILSHSALSMEPDRPLAKRTISPDHARVVAGTGGVIGMWPSGFFKSFDEFVDGTLKMIEVVGADHVGLGTDMDGNFKPVLDNYSQVTTWGQALRARGLSEEETWKVLGGNALRVLKQVLK